MALTRETLREMLIHTLGFDPAPEDLDRLLPLAERQLERMQALHALDLGAEDPRLMQYISDNRLFPPPAAETGQ